MRQFLTRLLFGRPEVLGRNRAMREMLALSKAAVDPRTQVPYRVIGKPAKEPAIKPVRVHT
jgi:hypothetical protein